MGPALGGCRFIHYDTDEAALVDALRLARGMTYKAALAGLPHGGGKSVIIRPTQHFDRVALFRAFGRFIDDLRGHYITAEDSGTGLEDMEVIRVGDQVGHGRGPSHGGSGDPSPFTALGVRRGIEACVEHKLGKDDARRACTSPCRASGTSATTSARSCTRAGREAHGRRRGSAQGRARAARVRREASCRSTRSSTSTATSFAPCALGLGAERRDHPAAQGDASSRAPRTTSSPCRATATTCTPAGSSTRPTTPSTPGGLINVAQEVVGYDEARRARKTMKIYDTIAEIVERSEKLKAPTYKVADMIVEERLAAASARGR